MLTFVSFILSFIHLPFSFSLQVDFHNSYLLILAYPFSICRSLSPLPTCSSALLWDALGLTASALHHQHLLPQMLVLLASSSSYLSSAVPTLLSSWSPWASSSSSLLFLFASPTSFDERGYSQQLSCYHLFKFQSLLNPFL